jgi:transposase
MRGRKAPEICLTQRQRWVLEDIVRRPSSSQRDVRRAAIILAAATGVSNQEIARQLHRDRDTVAYWRNRWHEFGDAWQALEQNPTVCFQDFRDLAAEVLGDALRPGAPLKFSAEQVCRIIAVACEKPAEESERPVSHWSRRELAEEVIKRGIVAQISPRSVGRSLNQAELQPHRSEYWLHPRREDAEEFGREVQQVCDVYLPKHTSWLNQVECWFGILVRRLLKRGSFRSVEERKARILAFVEYFNQTMAKPMRWTYTAF